ncbi:uncharacterized protein LTR77_002223 [Saxophila tyrrhenica]|uniref:Major facilitator superfamily (MFS) profile domain-containing protein n=1 Tax=Saxophila tyrrhenica TaxID=1690608 RepID=A0AAV9PHX1_9PEZI|nr:hypothetical protein LTR77_002223 [Saxophila tyrrhenica]
MSTTKQESELAVTPTRPSSEDEKISDDATPIADIEQQPPIAPPKTHKPQTPTLAGWRRNLILTSLFLGLFLSFLDTTIVAVALPTIATQFDDFDSSTWVLTAYLLTYMAFAIIISRFSDIFGKKTVEVASFSLFLAFSLACGLSKNMTQLIIFRALQGIGGSGLYSMTMIIALTIVEPSKMGMIGATVGMVLVTSGVLGPILSGAIANDPTSDTWRWIFYLNLPVGGLALVALLVAWPREKTEAFSKASFRRIDVLGCMLLLAASVLLIFALEEGGAFVYAWSSPTIITCLVVSGLGFVAFFAWQQCLAAHPQWTVQLVFPMSVLRQRVVGAAILITVFAGFNYYIAIVNLPQRFQIVDANSPVVAGVKLLPMMVSSAVGSLVGGGVNTRHNRTSYVLVASSAFQLLGYGLMTTLGDASPTPQKHFGFQVFLGFGFGLAMPAVTIIAQTQVAPQWIAVTQGALTQMRSLGGSIGLATGVIVFNSGIRHSDALANALSPADMSALLKSPLHIASFAPEQQMLVAKVFGQAFTGQMRITTYISAASLLVSLLTLERYPAPLQRPPPVESAEAASKGGSDV